MIIGIGIDMIEVERIDTRINRNNGFKEKIFSPDEITYCESQTNKAENYAARFAAKEAFLKAIGTGLTVSYELHEIEVIVNEAGKPSIMLSGGFKELSVAGNWNNIYLSISHLRAIACAVVIVEA
jgi:holo-[acyl-carrier protein] synthase